MSFELSPDFKTTECQDFCARVADGTHDSPKETAVGKKLVTSKNVKGGRLELDSAYLISAEDFESINKRSKVDQWDLLLTMIGTVGEVCLVTDPEPDFAIKNVGLLKCGNELKAKWLYYFLRSPQGQKLIEARKKGSTQQYVSLTELRRLPISYPDDQSVMRRIVEDLSAIDDRITLLRETNTTLEAIAQALFKSWFVDFDPVHAKMQGRAPEGMDEATAALFPASFEESELGSVPLGWSTGKLADIASLKGGKMLDKTSFSDSGANPVFGGAGVMGFSDLSNSEGFVITVGRVGAYCGQYFWHQGRAWVNNNASLVSPINPDDSCWLFLWLKNVDMDLIKKGAAQPFVSNGDISDLKIVLPPSFVVDKFVQFVEPIFKKLSLIREKTQSLEVLRDTLLPRLISGQLRLPDEESLTEEAVV